jgi:transcriptional regulator with XRE-family HTH domain
VSLAKKLVRARKGARLSQAELAKKIGKTRSCICEYEKGNHAPRLPVLVKISKITGVSLEELLA